MEYGRKLESLKMKEKYARYTALSLCIEIVTLSEDCVSRSKSIVWLMTLARVACNLKLLMYSGTL